MNVDLARWQFAFVTINHFFFVPVTIGLAFLTALLQTAWHRSKNDEYLRLTRFFGNVFGAPLAMEGLAAFIMAANSWIQHPVGYTMVAGSPSSTTSGHC